MIKENMKNNSNSNKFDWPDGEFTASEIKLNAETSLVTLYKMIKDGISNGSIEKVGQRSTKRGRPSSVFKTIVKSAGVVESTPISNSSSQAV